MPWLMHAVFTCLAGLLTNPTDTMLPKQLLQPAAHDNQYCQVVIVICVVTMQVLIQGTCTVIVSYSHAGSCPASVACTWVTCRYFVPIHADVCIHHAMPKAQRGCSIDLLFHERYQQVSCWTSVYGNMRPAINGAPTTSQHSLSESRVLFVHAHPQQYVAVNVYSHLTLSPSKTSINRLHHIATLLPEGTTRINPPENNIRN